MFTIGRQMIFFPLQSVPATSSGFKWTPLILCPLAADINIAILRAASSGFNPSGRMFETQFLSASFLPTRGDQVR
jgi:hypothetical protein